MRRRSFLVGALAAVAPPLQARSAPLPVIGFMSSGSPEAFASYVAALHEGLQEAGFVEGRNVAIEYRWARGRYERLLR